MGEPESFERLIFTTGSDEEKAIIEKRDRFFSIVLAQMGLSPDNPATRTETYFLTSNAPVTFEPQYPTTDDALHRLLIFDELIALVIDRRDDLNRHEVTFWHNEPSRICKTRIDESNRSLLENKAPECQ